MTTPTIKFDRMDADGEQFIFAGAEVVGTITRNKSATAAFGPEGSTESYSVEINGAMRDFDVNGRFWTFGTGYRTNRAGFDSARAAHSAAKAWARTNPADAA